MCTPALSISKLFEGFIRWLSCVQEPYIELVTMVLLAGIKIVSYLFFLIHDFAWLLPPTEGIEHVEKGDGHIDEDDQGKQGVWKSR